MDFDNHEVDESFVYQSSRYESMDGNVSPEQSANLSDNDTELWEEFIRFQIKWESLISIYSPLLIVLLGLGLIGNLLAFATLIRSQNLCTPTFLYHRVLVFAGLLFCMNYFVDLFIDNVLTYSQFVFGNWFVAYYSGTVFHVVHTTCSYIIIHMTIVIAFERFIALLLFRQYDKFNKHWVARIVVAGCILMSAVVHSWASWFQHEIVEYPSQHNNNCMIYTWIKREEYFNSDFVWVKVKNVYNIFLRIAYPIIISLLTAGVIYGFVKRQRHISERYRLSPSGTCQQRSRYEKTLFFFMISVIILAMIQIGATECRRILQLLYPPGEISSKKIADTTLPISERLYYFRILLYGYQISRIVSNLCTVINHSFIGYLYVAMNNLFRRELWALLCCKPVTPSGLIRARTNSYGFKDGYSVVPKDKACRMDSRDSRRSRTTTT